MVHHIEHTAVHTPEPEQPPEQTPPPSEAVAESVATKRQSQLLNIGRFVTRIQAILRGHRSRRAFRLALYQEALECGVLGAMPGTLQGLSGWYQDPKTFMAYYFAVLPDGEWRQKAVLRCSGLILFDYYMREQILSRVSMADVGEKLNDH